MDDDFPTKNKVRAKRRFFKQKFKRKAANFIQHVQLHGIRNSLDGTFIEQWAARHADNLKSCSCWMCGNPRRWLKKPTIQEKIQQQNTEDQIQELKQERETEMNIDEKYIKFLDNLQDWGVTNMVKAAPVLQQQFPELTLTESIQIVQHWNNQKPQLLNE